MIEKAYPEFIADEDGNVMIILNSYEEVRPLLQAIRASLFVLYYQVINQSSIKAIFDMTEKIIKFKITDIINLIPNEEVINKIVSELIKNGKYELIFDRKGTINKLTIKLRNRWVNSYTFH